MNIYYTLSKVFYFVRRKDIFRRFYFYKKKEFKSLDENLRFQEEELKKILNHAWKNVPYYKPILEFSGVIMNGDVNLNNFNKIPILTKEIIRCEGKNLYSLDYKSRKPIKNTSGGSTGEPVELIQDENYILNGRAITWMQNSFINLFPCSSVKLWGSEKDVFGVSDTVGKIKNFIQGITLLNSFKMTEEDMENYVKIINTKKPKIIEGYASSMYEFSKFVKRKNLKIHSPKGIITSASSLYSYMKELIGEVFSCPVNNRYGSRETSALACSCSCNEGLHQNIFTRFIEILNKNLNPVKEGEIGDVYVTTLDNYSMPLIRYKIGDAARATFKTCSCGRGMPLIKEIRGREVNMFKRKDGALIDGEFFTHLLYFRDKVIQFKVIQQDYDAIQFLIVGTLKESERLEIETKVRKAMGQDCNISWNFVKEIPLLSNGKYLYTVSHLKDKT